MPIGRNSDGNIVGPPGWKPSPVPRDMSKTKAPRQESNDQTAFEKHFAGIFMDILNDAAKVYESHIPEKGESWITCPIDELWTPWLVEAGEVLSMLGLRYNPHKVRRELLDVINQSLMLIKRIDEQDWQTKHRKGI